MTPSTMQVLTVKLCTLIGVVAVLTYVFGLV